MPSPAKPASPKGLGIVTRKAGPLPVYAWALLAIGGYLVLRKLGGGGSNPAAPAQPATQPLSSGAGATGGDGGAAAAADAYRSQQGVIDDLTAGILGSQQASEVINSNLVSGLMSTTNAITGLGAEALGLNGQLEQAIIGSYVPTAPAYSGGTASAGAVYAEPAATAAPSSAVSSNAVASTSTSLQSQIAASGYYQSLPAGQQESLMRGSMWTIPTYESHGGAIY